MPDDKKKEVDVKEKVNAIPESQKPREEKNKISLNKEVENKQI